MKTLKNRTNSLKKATENKVFVPYLRAQIMYAKWALLNMTHMRPLIRISNLYFSSPSLENISKKRCSCLIPMTFYGEIKSNESFVLANDFPLQNQQWVAHAQCENCRFTLTIFLENVLNDFSTKLH